VAINDTPEESYESIFDETANRFSSPISMAKPSTMESTGKMDEGKVDNKRKIMKGKILGPGHLCQDQVLNKFNFSNIRSGLYEATLPCLLLVIQGN
jgi:hypothetical protein